jgi:hypothetical protein
MANDAYDNSYIASNGIRARVTIRTGESDDAWASTNTEETAYVPTPAPSFDSQMQLAGLISSEITRYKEKLMNDSLYNLDNPVVVPAVTTTSPLITQMKLSNDLKQQKETREILVANVDKEYKKTDIQIKLRDLQLKESANSIEEAKLTMTGNFYIQNEKMIAESVRLRDISTSLRDNINSLKDYAQQQVQAIEAQTAAIKLQTEAIKTQTITLNGDMSANVNIDVTPLAVANNKIAEGVTNQIETNAKIVENIVKQNENLDFIKNGLPTLKDSKGNVIKPREAKALKSAEDSILSKDKNTFDSEKAIIQPLEKMLLDEKNLDSQTSSGFGDFELKSVLSEILKVDKTKFDFEYRTKLYSNDDPEGVK